MTLSGESADDISAEDNVKNNVNNNDNGKHLELEIGQGKGLHCEHFTQQGPLRCRG